MSITEAIRRKVGAAFAPIHFELENESDRHAGPPNRETHFRMVLVSAAFEGLSRIDRQRRVMDLFADERAQGLHALTLRTMTPDEWEKVKPTFEMVSPPCGGGSKRDMK